MSDLHRQPTTPKARKDHLCEACQHTIAKGEEHKQQEGYFDGRAYRNRFHFECWHELMPDENGNFEFFPGDLEPPKRLIRV